MPKLPELKTVAERVDWAMKAKGIKPNQLETRMGLKSHGYISNLISRGSDNITPKKVAQISKALGVDPAWLGTGDGEPGITGSVATVDPTKPESGKRAKPARTVVEHAFPEDVDDLDKTVVAKHPNGPGGPFSFSQRKAAKIYARDAHNELTQSANREAIYLNVLKVAQRLDLSGQEPTTQAILEVLATPPVVPIETPELEEAHKLNEQDGIPKATRRPR